MKLNTSEVQGRKVTVKRGRTEFTIKGEERDKIMYKKLILQRGHTVHLLFGKIQS